MAHTGRDGWRRIEWSEGEATIAGLGAADAVVADAVHPVDSNFDVVVAALDKERAVSDWRPPTR